MGTETKQNNFANELFYAFAPMKDDIQKVVVTVEDKKGNRVEKELTAQEFLDALSQKGENNEKTR
ncbi:hypothetical protein [Parasutterella secunda]|uniref:hypothetical protein n=1 Tax=Parasutterella secunda TaxID=626947 RepID=UPI0021ABB7BC|nr:hypothetical protein [Parasutterella secunda]MCR8920979.1 hypothetical protein [Parasutterella secunda]